MEKGDRYMKKSMSCLYLILFVLSCAIVFGSFWISNESWNTIVASIGCGGIASVFVAWLIDWQNHRNKKAENNKKFEMILHQYVNLYRRLIWTALNECYGLYQKGEKHNLKEWLSILSDETKYSPSQKASIKRRCERLSGNLYAIQKYIEEFQGQSATLILNDFPKIEEILLFFEVQHIHAWGSLKQLEDGNYKAFCDTTYILYNEFLEKFPQYKSEFPELYDSSLLKNWKY